MLLGKVLSIVAASAALLDGSMKAAMPDKNMEGTMFLINRQHAVSEFFVPETLRKVEATGMSQSMRDDAATALEEMFAAAKEEGVTLSTVSGYRSYSKQSTIYARKKASQGEEEADRVSARPGTSEHNLGLAADIVSADWYSNHSDLTADFEQTPQFAWLKAHCAEYGFILRYPQGKESVTGVTYEPWHYRYVGREAARIIMQRGITLEEYKEL